MDENLYREELMEIYKNPANRGSLNDPSVTVHATNPMCGDEVDLQLQISDGKINDAKFDGAACAVSIFSSELLLEELKGKSLKEAKNISKEKLLQIIGIPLTTSRVKCATLSLDALHDALKEYEKNH